MSREPTRLLDDREFIRETGCDLRDADQVLQGYNLPAMKAALAGAAVPAPTSTPPRLLRGTSWVVAGVLSVGGALWLCSLHTSPTPEVRPPVEVVAAPSTSPVPAAPATEPLVAPDPPEPAKPQLPATPQRPSAPAEPPAAEPVISAPTLPAAEPPTTEQAGDALAVADLEPRVERGDLQADLRAYQRGEDALAMGDQRAARAAFERYLEDWPGGRLREAAELALLTCLAQLEEYQQVELLADQLARHPNLASKRPEILSLRAQALVALGRCQEALALLPELERSAATSIRRSCRRSP